jgi:Ca-activated chloride channel family protein
MRKIFCAYIALAFCLEGCGASPEKAPQATARMYSEAAAAKAPSLVADFSVAQIKQAGEFDSEATPEAEAHNTEAYDHIIDNAFLSVARNPLSTFSIDVDTASYSNVRRFLTTGQLPPPGAVRIEELVNYFTYDDPAPNGDVPFSVSIEVAECPWNSEHRLARIGLKGKEVPVEERPASNLVFLVDVSGSMNAPNKLPLVQSGLKMLVDQLGGSDRVAIVVYAGSSGLALPSTGSDQKQIILSAIDNLQAGGSTNGGEGIQLAYQTAAENFIKDGINRVILCTDGDFNVGVTSHDELVRLIEEKARTKVFLTVLGFGMGNYQDSRLEKLADKGNGIYGYIDNFNEAKKLLVEQLQGTLMTIAKDVKVQIEFNPARIAAYRLIGYENRVMKAEDFNNDAKDAGDIGAGHSVTALYELVPAGRTLDDLGPQFASVEPLKYQKAAAATEIAVTSDDLFTLALRYKLPDADNSQRIEFPAHDRGLKVAQASRNFTWSAAVAAFGMLLRDSPHKGNATFAAVSELAQSARGADLSGYRGEFLQLVEKAKALSGRK